TQKRAYMKERNIKDRPSDFTAQEPVQDIEPKVELQLNQDQWEKHLRRISKQFLKHAHIQDSSVNLVASANNDYLVTSEGTRLRTGETRVQLTISAEALSDDGARISDSRTFLLETADGLPAVEEILNAVDQLSAGLVRVTQAPALRDYTGPVLFDSVASAQLFQQLLAGGVAGRADPVGTGRRRFRGTQNLEKRVGKRILPASFQVYDDPRTSSFDQTFLSGHYLYDAEGIPAKRVNIVVDGKLQDMAMSRIPTKKFSGSNGHARRPGRAGIGCLYIESTEGLSPENLKKALLEAAEEQGLDYVLRVTSLEGGSGAPSRNALAAFFRGGGRRGRGADQNSLSDPIHVYKVYVEDGREEPVRGCEFGNITVRNLRSISAAGDSATVYNHRGNPPSSIIAPAVLFEELDVLRIEQEYQTKPILKAPHTRAQGK
ncbi:MAG: metallopeptidase TldD-related protein, partial [Planctomycetota bacterium]